MLARGAFMAALLAAAGCGGGGGGDEQRPDGGPDADAAPVGHSPIAIPDLYLVDEGFSLAVDATAGVLVNDADPQGDPMTASLATGTAHGEVTLAADGSFSYQPEAGYRGRDSFTYSAVAVDGSGTSIARITVNRVLDLAWARGMGALSAEGVAVFPDGSCAVTGFAGSGAVFGDGEANETTVSAGIYVARFGADGDLLWAKGAGDSFGDSDKDYAHAIAPSTDGAVVVTGSYLGSATFAPGESNQTTLAAAGDSSLFVARYLSDGTLDWVRRAAGVGTGIASAPDGSLMVTGYFYESSTFGEGEPGERTLVPTGTGGTDAFVARYQVDGDLAWVQPIRGDFTCYGSAAAPGPSGSVLVTGTCQGDTTLEPEDVVLQAASGQIYVARYSSTGHVVWANHATGGFISPGLASFGDGSAAIAGTFVSAAVFGPDGAAPVVLDAIASYDFFTARFGPAGELAWARQATGPRNDAQEVAVAAAPDGSTLISATVRQQVVFGMGEPTETFLLAEGGQLGEDLFVASYQEAGQLAWASRTSGASDESGTAIAVGADGTAYLAGYLYAPVTFGPGTTNETTITPAGGGGTFITRFTP